MLIHRAARTWMVCGALLVAGCSQEPAPPPVMQQASQPQQASEHPSGESDDQSKKLVGMESPDIFGGLDIPFAATPNSETINPLRSTTTMPTDAAPATTTPRSAELRPTPEPTQAAQQAPSAGPLLIAPGGLLGEDPDAKPIPNAQPVERVAEQPTDVRRTAASEELPYGKTKADPIQANGPIFVDWSKPRVAIVLTGDQFGYIEPCGCAGLENQKGGLSRRHMLIKQLESQGWPVVSLELGNLVDRLGKQTEIKYAAAVEGLSTMGYQAIGLGLRDLRLPAGILVTVATERGETPFVSANVGLFAFDSGFTRRAQIVTAGGRKIGVTSVLGDAERGQLAAGDGLVMSEARQALVEVAPQLAESDFRVLLAAASPKESAELARAVPGFDVVVTSGGAEEPPNAPQPIAGTKTQLVEVGQKGMYAIVLGLYDDPAQPMRYQRVPLDARFADSPEMQQLKTRYQQQLQTLGWDGLELTPKRHPRSMQEGDLLGQFVGTQECAQCHSKAFGVWENSPHAHATQTLAKLTPPRQFDAECISCHATGWNAQGYFPYASGFLGLTSTAHLAENGCENCHGPGGAHVAAETGEIKVDSATQKQYREMMRVVLGAAANNSCTQCHDHDNSPDFKLETYWLQIEHRGKD